MERERVRGVERVECGACGACGACVPMAMGVHGGARGGAHRGGKGGGLGEVVVVFLDGVLDAEENGGAPVGEL